MIEITSLLLAFVYVLVSHFFLRKEPKLTNFIIIFLAIVYMFKCGFTIYTIILEGQNHDYLVYIIMGAVAILWVSWEKVLHFT